MWIQAIIARDDLVALVRDLVPVTVKLGDDAWIAVTELLDVDLVEGRGLRVSCKARIQWPVAGIAVPIALHSVTFGLRPEIVPGPVGDALVFHVDFDHVDVARVPGFIDAKISDRIRRALEGKAPTWDFTSTLSRAIPLPERLAEVDGLDLRVSWGAARITQEAVVLVVAFRAGVIRDGVVRTSTPPERKPGPGEEILPPAARSMVRRPTIPTPLAAAAAIGFFAGFVLAFAGRSLA